MTRRHTDTYRLIWEAVCHIPRGKVATYGEIARLAGFVGQARLVGYALHNTLPGFIVPWHRVINARGQISLPSNNGAHARQKKLLLREGIRFQSGTIDLDKFGWPKKRTVR